MERPRVTIAMPSYNEEHYIEACIRSVQAQDYPRELEEYFMTHPKVSLVAVKGIPDAKMGEEIKAYLVLKPGQTATVDEMMDFAKEGLAAYKYPRYIEFRSVLPMTATGKILKRELVDE